MLLESGQTFSHYRLISCLGKGAMGEVWLAEDIRLGHRVAIKFLVRALCEDSDHRNRLLREGTAIATVKHAGILPLQKFNEIDGQLYYVVDHVSGASSRTSP